VITLRLSTTEVFLRGARRIEKWSVLRPSAEPVLLDGRYQGSLNGRPPLPDDLGGWPENDHFSIRLAPRRNTSVVESGG